MSLHVWYVTGLGREEVFGVRGFHQAAEALGHRLTVVTFSPTAIEYCHSHGVAVLSPILPSPEVARPAIHTPEAFEARWQRPLSELAWPEAQYFEFAPERLHPHAYRWGALLDAVEDAPDVIVQMPGAEIHRRLIATWAAEQQIQHRIICFCPLPDRMIVHVDERHRLDLLSPDWREQPASAEESAQIDALLRWFREGKPKLSEVPKRRVSHEAELRAMKRYDALASTPMFFKAALLYNAGARLYPRSWVTQAIYSRKALPEKFFFFPLHVVQDSQVTVRNRLFYDQTTLIETIAWHLPAGYKVLVKAHPGAHGGLPPGQLARLLRNPAVHLAEPALHAHDLIRAAAGVLFLNSSVGYEATLLGTPSLCLGNWTYSPLAPGTPLDDWMRLGDHLLHMTQAPPPSEAEARTLLLGTLRATVPGSVYSLEPDYALLLGQLAESTRRAEAWGWPGSSKPAPFMYSG